jgi:hypothetical protein
MPIPLRADFDARMVRAAARWSKDGPQARLIRGPPFLVRLRAPNSSPLRFRKDKHTALNESTRGNEA